MTEERRIQLVAEVDATGARAGLNEISREAGTMSAAVGRNAQQAETAVAGIGSGAGRSAAQIESAGRNLIGSIQRQTAAMEAGSRTGAAYYEVLARQRGVDPAILAPYLASLRAVEQAQTRTNSAVAGAAAPLRQVGVSAAQTNAALRGLPAQFSDIVVSLQGGQRPLSVLLQQGSQIRDTFGGTGEALRGVGTYVRGLIGPLGIAAGVVAALALAYKQGSDEATAYNRALILSGNIAGTSAGQLSNMARAIAKSGATQGEAAAALAALAGTGQVAARNLQQFAEVAVLGQRNLGQSVADTAAQFAELGKSPLTTLVKLNEQYHFLTPEVYRAVKALQDQGRVEEAASTAQKAYSEAFGTRAKEIRENLGTLESAWKTSSETVKKWWDAVLNVGRENSKSQQVNVLQGQIAAVEKTLSNLAQLGDNAENRKNIESAQKALGLLREKQGLTQADIRLESQAGEAAARNNAQREAGLRFDQEGEKYQTRAVQLKNALIAAENEGRAAGKSDADIAKRKSDIQKSYADIFNDGIDSNIEALKRRAAVEDVLTQRIITRINATRAIGGITEADVINQTADAEDKAFARNRANLVKELELSKGKQNSLKEQQALSGQIAVLDAERTSAQIKREQDLIALAFQRAQVSRDLYNSGINAAKAESDSIAEQIKGQLDYNEEIGQSATAIMLLRNTRLLGVAALKDETAAALESIEPGSEQAQQYRDTAAQLRSLAAAQRDAFTKQRDPFAALTASVKRYGDEASDVGSQIGNAMSNAFRGAEDAFVTFVTTGKLSFSSLATSILGDIARIQAKKALAGLADLAISSFFGAPAGAGSAPSVAGARAAGGPVSGGLSYLVGEKGPEIFTPSSNGKIIANHAIGGGGDVNITMQTIIQDGGANTTSSGGAGADVRAAADGLNAKFKQVIATELRPGGLLYNMKQGRA